MYKLYKKAFDECMATISEQPKSDEGGPANPLLINPHNNYSSSDLKVMYFGQETNGYEGAYSESKGIDHLLDVYDGFVNKRGCYAYRGQFWNGVKHFQLAFKGIHSNSEFVWNNIVKVGKDWSKGCPSEKVLMWQKPWSNIIPQEVKILSPDVVIFFTGPNYDHLIKNTFTDVNFEPVGDFSIRQLAKINSENLPCNTYRTYHPGYLWRIGFHKVKDAIIDNINKI
jgi:hypothetical protein